MTILTELQNCGGWGWLVEIIVMIYCFAGLAIVCDDYMVPALETLCVRWGVREDVAGATFMAFGSAAPEIIINVVQTIKQRVQTTGAGTGGQDQIALGVGAIIGSGMIAFMIIPSTCAMFSEGPLRIKRRPMLRDMVFYSVCLFLTTMFIFTDNEIVLWEATVLVVIYIIYVATVVFSRSVRRRYLRDVKGQVLVKCDSFVIRERERRAQGLDAPEKERLAKVVEVYTEQGLDIRKQKLDEPLLKQKGEQKSGKVGKVTTEMGNPKNTNKVHSPIVIPPKAGEDDDDDSSSGHEHVGPSLAGTKRIKQIPRKGSKDSRNLSVSANNDDRKQSSAGLSIEDVEESAIMNGRYGCLITILKVLKFPLDFMFRITCPQTEIGTKWESFYPIAFVISFGWVAFFSFIISEIVEEWVVATGINEAFFGLTLIAIGAEVPDTIQSVTVAKRGYGSMAVSNCIGSQIVNLCIGLGLSWFLGILTSKGLTPITLTQSGVDNVFQAACVQGVAVTFAFFMFFGPTVYSRCTLKISLTKAQGMCLFAAYVISLSAYATIEVIAGDFN